MHNLTLRMNNFQFYVDKIVISIRYIIILQSRIGIGKSHLYYHTQWTIYMSSYAYEGPLSGSFSESIYQPNGNLASLHVSDIYMCVHAQTQFRWISIAIPVKPSSQRQYFPINSQWWGPLCTIYMYVCGWVCIFHVRCRTLGWRFSHFPGREQYTTT